MLGRNHLIPINILETLSKIILATRNTPCYSGIPVKNGGFLASNPSENDFFNNFLNTPTDVNILSDATGMREDTNDRENYLQNPSSSLEIDCDANLPPSIREIIDNMHINEIHQSLIQNSDVFLRSLLESIDEAPKSLRQNTKDNSESLMVPDSLQQNADKTNDLSLILPISNVLEARQQISSTNNKRSTTFDMNEQRFKRFKPLSDDNFNTSKSLVDFNSLRSIQPMMNINPQIYGQDHRFQRIFENFVTNWNQNQAQSKQIDSCLFSLFRARSRMGMFAEARILKRQALERHLNKTLTVLEYHEALKKIVKIFKAIIPESETERKTITAVNSEDLEMDSFWSLIFNLIADIPENERMTALRTEPTITNVFINFVAAFQSPDEVVKVENRLKEGIRLNGRNHHREDYTSIEDSIKYFNEEFPSDISKSSFERTIAFFNRLLCTQEFSTKISNCVHAGMKNYQRLEKPTLIVIDAFSSCYFTIPFFKMYYKVLDLVDKDNFIHAEYLARLKNLLIDIETPIFEVLRDRMILNRMGELMNIEVLNKKIFSLSDDRMREIKIKILALMTDWCDRLEALRNEDVAVKQWLIINFLTSVLNIAQVTRIFLMPFSYKNPKQNVWRKIYDCHVFESIVFSAMDFKRVAVFVDRFIFKLLGMQPGNLISTGSSV